MPAMATESSTTMSRVHLCFRTICSRSVSVSALASSSSSCWRSTCVCSMYGWRSARSVGGRCIACAGGMGCSLLPMALAAEDGEGVHGVDHVAEDRVLQQGARAVALHHDQVVALDDRVFGLARADLLDVERGDLPH